MSETQQPQRNARRIGAVLAGLLVVVVLSIATDTLLHATGIYPRIGEPMGGTLWLLATFYRLIYAVAGSYVAARLAPDRPMQHAMLVGLVGLVLSIVGAVATWNAGPSFGPRWYPLALIAIALPCAWAGGRLHAMQSRAHTAG
jgi:hypothetical protein